MDQNNLNLQYTLLNKCKNQFYFYELPHVVIEFQIKR